MLLRPNIIRVILGSLVMLSMPGLGLASNSESTFYKGKSITLIIPSGPGGGYDRYSRLVGRHIGKYIPGQPHIVPQNMPGAGGVVAANYLANVAAKDGTVFGSIQNGVPFKPLLDDRQVRYKVSDFLFLGSVTPAANIGIVPRTSSFKSVDDIFNKTLMVGGSGGTTVYLPLALNHVLGTKLKLIKGYKSTNNILLAMERGEVGGLVGIDWSSFKGSAKGRLENYRVLFQMGTKRHKELNDIPLIQEKAPDEESKAVLEVLFASFGIGRSFVVPVIPEKHLATLRMAFRKTMKNEDFSAEARKVGAEVNPLTPEEIKEVIEGVYEQPKTIIDRAQEAISIR